MFSEFLADDANIQKTLLPEYVDYYSTAMLWFRMISLKIKLNQGITQTERDVLLMLDQSAFALPEPLMMQIRMLGSIQSPTKEHLKPTFPELPVQQVEGYGGYYGVLNQDTHNLYEEIPCLGVLAEAVRNSLSNAPSGPYRSSLATNELALNENLLGYRNLANHRNEAKNLAFDTGITPDHFPEYPQGSGINLGLLQAISAQLAQTKTFRVQTIAFNVMAESGSVIQICLQHPEENGGDNLEKRGEVSVQSVAQLPDSSNGASIVFCPQMLKTEQTPAASIRWACASPVPQSWINNRNDRRNNLPEQYRCRVFRSISQHCRQYRVAVLRQMVLTKR